MDARKLGETLAAFRNAWSKGTCLHPDAPNNCSGKPIDSHTLQKSRILESIAENSHVLVFKQNHAEMLKTALNSSGHSHDPMEVLREFKEKGVLAPTTVGLKDASVFPGFCSYHDHKTFAPIEDGVLCFDDRQCFLFIYRAVCMQLWASRAKLKTTEFILEKLATGIDFEVAKYYDELGLGELSLMKSKLDLMLLAEDYATVRALVFSLDANPQVATSGVTAPEVDFEDNLLQDICDDTVPLEAMAYCLLPSPTNGNALIGWIDSSPCVEHFVESLLQMPEEEKPDALLRLSFESFENTYFAPSWWGSLHPDLKAWCGRRSLMGALTGKSISYKPDGMHLASFTSTVLRAH